MPLAEGCVAVILSPHDAVDVATLQLLVELGVKLIALRSAGYIQHLPPEYQGPRYPVLRDRLPWSSLGDIEA